jgi:hypothetical protein
MAEGAKKHASAAISLRCVAHIRICHDLTALQVPGNSASLENH